MYWLGWVESRTSAARARGAERGQLVAALLHLAVELRQVGMGGVGRQRRGHPVHADAVARAVGR